MDKIIRLLLIILFFFFLSPVETRPSSDLDVTLTPPTIAQGEVALLSIQKLGKVKPKVIWMGKKITLFSDKKNETWEAFIGADLTTKPGRYNMKITLSGSNKTHAITVNVPSRDYGVRRLTLPKEMVELDATTLKRVLKESSKVRELFISSADYLFWEGSWIRPVPGTVVSPFGCRCIINGMERSPHSGVDLKAAESTPIKAPNRGRVVLVANHFFSGLSVVIDHGGGIQSMYFHLSHVFVDVSQLLEKGTIIGLSGSSGRVTGPHLHFGIRLNGGRVDPIKLIEISGRLER
ncbi:MAG: M23 family metallopeptidase [Deltaproteobacteria bacterium]|nr:M23 family metallopeptidase [Deltaproteobacteria bacterium]